MKIKHLLMSIILTLIVFSSLSATAATNQSKAVSVDLNSDIKGTYKIKDQEKVFKFEMVKEGTVYISFLNDNANWWRDDIFSMRLEDSKGNRLNLTNISGLNSETFMISELNEGSYYLILEANGLMETLDFHMNLRAFPMQSYHDFISEGLNIVVDLIGATPKALIAGESIETSIGARNLDTNPQGNNLNLSNNDIALFSFTPTSTQRYNIEIFGIDKGIQGYILDENYKILCTNDTVTKEGTSGNNIISNFGFESGKQYYFALINLNYEPIKVTTKIIPLNSNFIEIEPNNSFKQATTLSIDKKYDGLLGEFPGSSLINSIESNFYVDYDWYKIELNENELATFILEKPLKDSPMYGNISMSVFDENLKKVAFRESDGQISKITLPLGLKKGIYYILINENNSDRAYDWTHVSKRSPYTVSYSVKTPLDFIDFEPNDGIAFAQTIKFGKKINSYFNMHSDQDFYKIVIPKDMDLRVNISAFDDYKEANHGKYLVTILNANGKSIERLVLGTNSIYKTDFIKQNGKLKTFGAGSSTLKKGTYYLKISPLAYLTSDLSDNFQYFENRKSNDKRDYVYSLVVSEWKDSK